MTDSLPISLDTLSQEHLRELIPLLNKAFAQYDINYYILGALAKDAWFSSAGIQSRTTRDIDFAIYVDSDQQYEELITTLVNEFNFHKIAPFKLKSTLGSTIDLIPFGIASIDEKYEFKEGWNEPIYINGLKEVFDSATVTVFEEETNVKFRIATLPGILLLKLIAYDDRPEKRIKDPKDIRDIIHNYFDIEDEFIWENHHDLFEEDLKLHEYSAIVIGRELKTILSQNKVLRDRVLDILSLQHHTQQRMVEIMAGSSTDEQQVKRWLKLIEKGIKK